MQRTAEVLGVQRKSRRERWNAATVYHASGMQIDACGAWKRSGSVRVGAAIVRPSGVHVVLCSGKIDREAASSRRHRCTNFMVISWVRQRTSRRGASARLARIDGMYYWPGSCELDVHVLEICFDKRSWHKAQESYRDCYLERKER